jgi:TetR/AcrR family transcriptional repressor of nem operon
MPKSSKRDQLVEATKELLWEVGYEAMSPRDIQARSAVKPGSLYHHFPSKLAIAEVALGSKSGTRVCIVYASSSVEGRSLRASTIR